MCLWGGDTWAVITAVLLPSSPSHSFTDLLMVLKQLYAGRGQAPTQGVAEGISGYLCLLHVSRDAFPGVWQQRRTGDICCNFLKMWFAEPVMKLCSAAHKEGCSQNWFLKQMQWEILNKDVCSARFRNTLRNNIPSSYAGCFQMSVDDLCSWMYGFRKWKSMEVWGLQ